MVLNESYIGMSIDAGTAAVMEGNRILHCQLAGPWHDSYSTRDLIARDNWFHDVGVGAAETGGNPLVDYPGDLGQRCTLIPSGTTITCAVGGVGHEKVHDLV